MIRTPSPSGKRLGIVGRLGIGTWGIACLFVGAVLASFHQPFREPDAAIASLAAAAPRNTWRIVHFVAADCDCSRRVMQHLIARGVFDQVYEAVVIIGHGEQRSESRQLAARGFHVSAIREQDLAEKFGLKGVPLLIFLAPSGSAVYMGGYGVGSYQDAALWNDVRGGLSPRSLPVLGCAVGARLKSQADPFFWKYH